MSDQEDIRKYHNTTGPRVDWNRVMMDSPLYDSFLNYNAHHHHYNYSNSNSNNDVVSAPQPTAQEMLERQSFRQRIADLTKQQRRIIEKVSIQNIASSLSDRQVKGRTKRNYDDIQSFAEYSSVVRYDSSYLHHLGGKLNTTQQGQDEQQQEQDTTTTILPTITTTSSPAVSTISIAFSPDSQTMASTHGDHTVKISCCFTGRLLETLEGHPRTPWTVKYHPTKSNMIASGCLGYQVRVWDWPERTCLHMVRLHNAIISLSFHPTGHVLGIASGSRLHFWDYNNEGGLTRVQQNGQSIRSSRGVLTELEQRHMLRCVHFPPSGDTLIVGGMNPMTEDVVRSSTSSSSPNGRGGMSGGGMSFYLRLFDFSLNAALHPYANNNNNKNGEHLITTNRLLIHRKILSNPRTFVPRALLYNDGGFDVSPDGKVLCACAEYWLPDGVNSAMELLKKEQEKDLVDSDDDDGGDDYNADDENEEEKESQDQEEEEQSMDDSDMQLASPSNNSTLTMDDAATDGHTNRNLTVTPVPHNNNNNEEEGGRSFSSPTRAPNAAAAVPPPPGNVRTPPILPTTPPNPNRPPQPLLSPPSPPGRRWMGGLSRRRGPNFQTYGSTTTISTSSNSFRATSGNMSTIPPPPPAPRHHLQLPIIKPHPLTIVSGEPNVPNINKEKGRFVPHVVTISLDTSPIAAPPNSGPVQGRGQVTLVAKGHRPRLGQLLEACPLDGTKASGVTCVKFSPSADFLLLGYGVRELQLEDSQDSNLHPVTSLYRVRDGMTHVSTMLSSDDDVNIARFHPDSGYGFVYGTKQGRVRILSPRPWNYYNY